MLNEIRAVILKSTSVLRLDYNDIILVVLLIVSTFVCATIIACVVVVVIVVLVFVQTRE